MPLQPIELLPHIDVEETYKRASKMLVDALTKVTTPYRAMVTDPCAGFWGNVFNLC